MDQLRDFLSGLYEAIGDIATRYLGLEIIPGLHMYTLVIIGIFAALIYFVLSGGEST